MAPEHSDFGVAALLSPHATSMPSLLLAIALFRGSSTFLLSFKVHVGFSSFMGNYIVSQLLILGSGCGAGSFPSDEIGDG